MNPQPAPYDWWTCASVITLELFVFFVAAKLASRRVASAARQRNLWQITLLAMLLVLIGELNGVRGWLRWPEMEGKFPPSHTALVTTWNPESVEFIVPFAGFAAVTTVPGATPQTATESDSPRPRVPWLAIGLLGITALLLFRMAVAQPLTIAFRMPARRWPESNLAQLAQRLAVKMGIERRVTLARSVRTSAPFTFAVVRPVIVLPNHFQETFTAAQQEVALTHELAHLAGFDSAWRTLSHLLCAMLWWHPCVWLARRELDRANELVTDDASLLV